MNAADINKCAEALHTGNYPADGHSQLQRTFKCADFLLFHFLEKRTARQDYISAVLRIFSNEKLKFLADVGGNIINFFRIHLRVRTKTADIRVYPDGKSAFNFLFYC